jgi:hypothetical protein
VRLSRWWDETALWLVSGVSRSYPLDADALLEQVVQDDQPLQEVAAEPVDLLDGQ